MNWTRFRHTDNSECTAFVDIMRQMDHSYCGLDVKEHLEKWLDKGKRAAYACKNDEKVVAVMLGKWRDPQHCPDLQMLGWFPSPSGGEGEMAESVIRQGDILLYDLVQEYAATSKNPPRMVRCIIPKKMDYPPIARLHQEICRKLRETGRVVREFDMADSWVCYFRRK
ncbi:MAG: hypothetical protein DWQ37_06605 [Planctomycetota bacterium]|nr:MAG: hypothetical protein DWQ37_06605 [Planctomycetota bacterium]